MTPEEPCESTPEETLKPCSHGLYSHYNCTDKSESIKEKLMKFSPAEVVCFVTILGEEVPVSRDEALGLFGCRPETTPETTEKAQSLEEWACDECHSVFYTNDKTSCECPHCNSRARYCGTLYFKQQPDQPAVSTREGIARTGAPALIKGKMHSYIIDLCSFHVEAKNPEEAHKEAVRMIEVGEEVPKVENVTSDEPDTEPE